LVKDDTIKRYEVVAIKKELSKRINKITK